MHLREILLSIHLLAVIVWIGFGLLELWLGRVFLSQEGAPVEGPLIRFIYRADLVVFVATLVGLASGLAMALTLGWGLFQTPWLGAKQAIMLGILGVVAVIMPRAQRLGACVSVLPAGPGPATPEIRAVYRQLEPWFLVMRGAAVVAVLLAVWRPV